MKVLRRHKLSKTDKLLAILAAVLILTSGFYIKINSFHWEFKGLVRIIFKLIHGEDLEV